MSALLTQCPNCQTSFRVTSAQLNAANGVVRCGSCLKAFSATANEIRVKAPDGYIVEVFHEPDDEPLDEPFIPETFSAPLAASSADIEDDERHTSEPVTASEPVATEITPSIEEHFQEEVALDRIVATPDELLLPEDDLIEEEIHDDFATGPAESAVTAFPDQDYEPHHTEFEPALGDLQLHDLDAEFDDEAEDSAHVVTEDHFDDDISDDELAQAEAMSADTDDEYPRESEPPPAPSTPDKQRIRSGLSSLNLDDDLAPVSADELDAIDEEPLTLDYRKSLRSRLTTLALLAVNALLIAALPLPWLYVHRNDLASHPRFGFLAPVVCEYLGCEQSPAPATTAPPAVSTSSMYTQQLLVRSHPRLANALEVSFVFHNDATQQQPFPDLELDFSDPANRLLANRLFTPKEYLPPELSQSEGMPAKSSVQVQLELVDPGSEAVNYRVVLHPH